MECLQAHVTEMVAEVKALSCPLQVAAALGALVMLRVVVGLVAALWVRVRHVLRGNNLRRRFGSWAVVTGATDGIGRALAHELAARKLNVVLISRTLEKLEATAAELREQHQVETRVVVADFTEGAKSGLYERIAEQLQGLEVGVLVNNVGMSYPSALFFHELGDYAESKGVVDDMVNMNVVSVTKMTQLVVKGMVERKKGFILNISSAAGRVPVGNPMYAEYSASKAYVDFFSRSLATELASKGVLVQCQSPYFVLSKLSKLRDKDASLFNITPQAYARASLAAIDDGASVVPYWSHALQDWVLQTLPEWLVSRFLMNLHHGIRARFLKKLGAGSAAAEPKKEQ